MSWMGAHGGRCDNRRTPMDEGYRSRWLQVVTRVVRRVRRSGARLGAVAAALIAAALGAASLLQAGAAAGAVATTTNPEVITGALVAPDGRHVVVPYTGGGCVVGARLTAAQTDSTVTLWLRQVMSG